MYSITSSPVRGHLELEAKLPAHLGASRLLLRAKREGRGHSKELHGEGGQAQTRRRLHRASRGPGEVNRAATP